MTQATIRIRQGSYRNRSVDGMTFELVSQFTKTAKNSFVTVRNGGNFPNMPETIRVNVSSPADYEFVSGAVIEPTAVENTVETDQQVMERIRERFEILTDMTKAAISGEELSYELKGVQESQFVPSALFVFNLNKDPSLSGDQVAIETRFHVFRFSKTFMATPTEASHIQADPRLKDDPSFIQQQICPAFLNWLLEGMALSMSDGIDYSSGRQAMEDVRRASCHLWEFCDAVGLTYEEGSQVAVKRVWEALLSWYREEGYLDDRDRWLVDPPADRTVKAARLLVPALRQIFPKLASARVGKSRDRLLMGLRLDAW